MTSACCHVQICADAAAMRLVQRDSHGTACHITLIAVCTQASPGQFTITVLYSDNDKLSNVAVIFDLTSAEKSGICRLTNQDKIFHISDKDVRG